MPKTKLRKLMRTCLMGAELHNRIAELILAGKDERRGKAKGARSEVALRSRKVEAD